MHKKRRETTKHRNFLAQHLGQTQTQTKPQLQTQKQKQMRTQTHMQSLILGTSANSRRREEKTRQNKTRQDTTKNDNAPKFP